MKDLNVFDLSIGFFAELHPYSQFPISRFLRPDQHMRKFDPTNQLRTHLLFIWACPLLPPLSPDIGKRLKIVEIIGRTAKNRRRAGNSQDFIFFTVISYIFVFFAIFSQVFLLTDAHICSQLVVADYRGSSQLLITVPLHSRGGSATLPSGCFSGGYLNPSCICAAQKKENPFYRVYRI